MKKEAEKVEKAGKERRTARRGGLPVAPHTKLQPSPTKANLPRPFSSFQLSIPTVN